MSDFLESFHGGFCVCQFSKKIAELILIDGLNEVDVL
jgi:hypothetical protein